METNNEKIPRTRQEAYTLDLIGDVVALDKEIQNLRNSFNGFRDEAPKLADKEMKRAGEAALDALSSEVAKIARRVAGDAAAAESHNAFVKACVFATGALLVSGLVFSGGGFVLAKFMGSISVSAAKNEVADLKQQILDLEKKSKDEIVKIQSGMGWLGTPTGQLAKRFFESGDGAIAAKCKSTFWEIQKRKNGNFCVPKRRDIFGDSEEPGWRIP